MYWLDISAMAVGSLPPAGEGWGEGFRSIDRVKPLTRIASLMRSDLSRKGERCIGHAGAYFRFSIRILKPFGNCLTLPNKRPLFPQLLLQLVSRNFAGDGVAGKRQRRGGPRRLAHHETAP